MERTPSPVHIPVVPTGDDNARLAVDEAGVVIGDRIGPLIAEDAPLRVPRTWRCIRRIATAQGGVGPGYTDPRPVIDAGVAMRDARCAMPWLLECFGVEDLAARAGCQEPTSASQTRPASGDHFSSRSADRRCWPGCQVGECGQHGVPGGVSDLVAAVGADDGAAGCADRVAVALQIGR